MTLRDLVNSELQPVTAAEREMVAEIRTIVTKLLCNGAEEHALRLALNLPTD